MANAGKMEGWMKVEVEGGGSESMCDGVPATVIGTCVTYLPIINHSVRFMPVSQIGPKTNRLTATGSVAPR